MVLVEQICSKIFKVNLPVARKSLRYIVDNTEYKGWKLGVQFIDSKEIHKLNLQYRSVDKATDILSFPFHEPLRPGVLPGFPEYKGNEALLEDLENLGDLYICLSYVENMCKNYEISIEERLPVLFVHGVCHLLGYDHERDEDFKQMNEVETKLLTKYLAWKKEQSKLHDMTHLTKLR